MNMEETRAGHLQSLADPLPDLMGQVLKCERDPWAREGHIICGGPKALEAVLHDQRLHADWILLMDFERDGPGGFAFLLLYHQEPWVPSWAPEYFGHFYSRPWTELLSIDGFAELFKEACNKHNWILDLTCRAAGDCLWHSAVIFQTLQAKIMLPRSKPNVIVRPKIQAAGPHPGPLPLADAGEGEDEEAVPIEENQ